MHVDGFVAILMVNNYIVTSGRTIRGSGNSGTGGVDRPAGSGIQINALMIGRSSGSGRHTGSEGAGDGGIGGPGRSVCLIVRSLLIVNRLKS